MEIYYQVRLRYYQYNDGLARNGYYTMKENFEYLTAATDFLNRIILDDSSYAWEFLLINGYFTEKLGIWKITEEKL